MLSPIEKVGSKHATTGSSDRQSIDCYIYPTNNSRSLKYTNLAIYCLILQTDRSGTGSRCFTMFVGSQLNSVKQQDDDRTDRDAV
jgi:hypothetical protein